MGSTVTPSGRRYANPVEVITPSVAGVPGLALVDLLSERQQRGRRLVRFGGVHLHLECAPSAVWQGDDDVDFVVVLVAPVVDPPAEPLCVDAHIPYYEVLEEVAGGVEVCQELAGSLTSAATAREGSVK